MGQMSLFPERTASKKNRREPIVPGKTRSGMLLVIKDLGTDSHGNRHWLCRCDCGKTKPVSQVSLRAKKPTRSCGCKSGEWIAAARTKHGGTPRGRRTLEYRIWGQMLQRCNNPNDQRYPLYGARGVRVCDRWSGEDGFRNFMDDMGPRPAKHSVERINNDGNYEPGNCRWATHREQMNNTRKSRFITFNGRTLTHRQWDCDRGFPPGTIHRRLAAGWSEQRAITEPRGPQGGQRA